MLGCACLLLAAVDALSRVGSTRLPGVARAAVRADLSAFEKSFMDDLYMEDYLDKNKALCDLRAALPSLVKGADVPALRRGIDEAREAQASVAELKPFILALRKADPSLITEVDEAILAGAEEVRIASAPQPAKTPLDSFLLDDQFEALLAASRSKVYAWDVASQGPCPDDLLSAWGKPLIFFSLLRHPRIDPSPVVWAAVRKQWPELGNIPDDELQKNLVACRKEYCDVRMLDNIT
jgi:hypothetical protein